MKSKIVNPKPAFVETDAAVIRVKKESVHCHICGAACEPVAADGVGYVCEKCLSNWRYRR